MDLLYMVIAHVMQGKVKLVLKQFFIDRIPCSSKEHTWIELTALKDTFYLMLKDTDFTFAKTKVKCTHECEQPTTTSATVSLPPTNDELSEYLTQTAKDKTITLDILSLLGPQCNNFHSLLTLCYHLYKYSSM